MKVFEALHTDCIHESAYYTISIHRTREGAEKVIKEHRERRMPYYEELRKENFKRGFTYELESLESVMSMEDWMVQEVEVLD